MKNPSGETEHFYLARIKTWNFADRSGPEFQRDDRGEYLSKRSPHLRSPRCREPAAEEISVVLREVLDHGELLAPV
ncbi:hypothetical protein [Streptomyces finlayi]|uniref:hypothetical protein n=1 Tax=Streptomyces finlayi TaxID=67296 RepID=UPI0016265FF2|nr:hypothetical protein [Streptomyces finlayi]